MGLLNKLFGYRWAMHIVRNRTEIVYIMEGDDVSPIVCSVMTRFEKGCVPVPPWSLFLIFNKSRKSFELRPEQYLNRMAPLYTILTEIDPEWVEVAKAEPVFYEASTMKKIKILGPKDFNGSWESIQNITRPKEPTFSTIMDEVFGGKERFSRFF